MIIQAKVTGANVSYEAYSKQMDGIGRGHRQFVMSRSEITNFASNPKRWLDGYRDEESDTTATAWGSLIDLLAMTPEKFDERYAVAPAEYADEKTGKMKDWNWNANVCKAWREEQGDREVIKSDLLEKAKLAIAAIQNNADVSELLKCSAKQVMVVGVWKDPDTKLEIPVRCLIDLVPDVKHERFGKMLADFKTARDGNPALWARVVDSCGYDVQASLSTDLYLFATKEDRTDWLFPLQENVKPWHVVAPIPALTHEFLEYGRAKYSSALRHYAHCLSTGVWPSYPTGDRMVFGGMQYIGPESLWAYRESAGLSRQFNEPEQPKKSDLPENHDVPTP